MEFFYQSSTCDRYLSSEPSDFPYLASLVETKKKVEMVNLGKEIENEKK